MEDNAQDGDHDQLNNNMQLGFIELIEPSQDHVFSSLLSAPVSNSFQANPEAVRQWAHYFSPGVTSHNVDIPLFQSDFFTYQLLNPLNFMWAKNFLTSPALEMISSDQGSIQFSIPERCPLSNAIICPKASVVPGNSDPKGKSIIQEGTVAEQLVSSSQTNHPQFLASPLQNSVALFGDSSNNSTGILLNDILQKVNSSPGPWSKSFLRKAGQLDKPGQQDSPDKALSDEDLRRSKRQQTQKQGYKDVKYKDKNCIGCSVDLPTLSHTIINNLGASFCKVDSSKLIEEALKKKKLAAPPGGRKLKKKTNKINDGVCFKGMQEEAQEAVIIVLKGLFIFSSFGGFHFLLGSFALSRPVMIMMFGFQNTIYLTAMLSFSMSVNHCLLGLALCTWFYL